MAELTQAPHVPIELLFCGECRTICGVAGMVHDCPQHPRAPFLHVRYAPADDSDAHHREQVTDALRHTRVALALAASILRSGERLSQDADDQIHAALKAARAALHPTEQGGGEEER